MKALVLDFDGVISNSAREAFVVAVRTECELQPASPLRGVLEHLDPKRPDDTPLYRRFLELMPLGNRAEDYGVALRALERGVVLANQRDYDAFKARHDPAWLHAFHQRFYQLRAAWRDADPEGWLELMAPYPAVVDLLRRRGRSIELAIATSKDGGSVRALLDRYGIAALFPEERVLDKETGATKRAHLEHLRRRLGWAPAQTTFLDDKVSHLEAVASLGVRCALAAWGYNAEREHHRARELGWLVCTLEDVERRLFDPS